MSRVTAISAGAVLLLLGVLTVLGPGEEVADAAAGERAEAVEDTASGPAAGSSPAGSYSPPRPSPVHGDLPFSPLFR